MQSTRGAAILAAVAVLTGGLTACGDDSEPQESTTTASPIDRSTDSPSSSESSSSSGSETSSGDGSGGDAELPDDLQAEARENTKEGAAAFGEYYHTAFGDAAESGDTQLIESLRSPDCKACIAGEKQISDDKAKGWVRDSNPYSFSKLSATKRPDEGYKVTMDVKAKKHYRVDASGKRNATVKPVSFDLTQHVIWTGDHWTMNSWIAQIQ